VEMSGCGAVVHHYRLFACALLAGILGQNVQHRSAQAAMAIQASSAVLLFCLASDTNWVKAGVSHSTAQHLLVRNLVERNHATDFALTDQGLAVLDALIRKARPG
jgi:hypothetical protein